MTTKEKVKLPRLTREEWRVMRSMTALYEGVEDFMPKTLIEEFFKRSYQTDVQANLDVLVARNLLEKNGDGTGYKTTNMGFRAEWGWSYRYYGMSGGTAKNFNIPAPEGTRFFDYFKLSEEQLSVLFDIVPDAEAIEWWSQPDPVEEEED